MNALIRRFTRMIRGKPRSAFANPFTDAVFGVLQLSDDADWWQITKCVGGHESTFRIAGDLEPNARLLTNARALYSHLPALAHEVDAFLAAELTGKDLLYYAEEIRGLKLSSISLLWTTKPNQAEIEFTGGVDGRIWGCAYGHGRLYNLGFDS